MVTAIKPISMEVTMVIEVIMKLNLFSCVEEVWEAVDIKPADVVMGNTVTWYVEEEWEAEEIIEELEKYGLIEKILE